MQRQQILHVVQARGFSDQPLSRSQRALRKNVPARCTMRQFNPFSCACKIECVLADNVSTPDRVNPDFVPGSFAD